MPKGIQQAFELDDGAIDTLAEIRYLPPCPASDMLSILLSFRCPLLTGDYLVSDMSYTGNLATARYTTE